MNKIKETDYITFCKICKKPLIVMGKELIHPEGDCKEEDGTKILIQYRRKFEKFQKKYKTPKENIRGLIKGYNNLIEEQERFNKSFVGRLYKWFQKVNQKEIPLKTKSIKN